MLRDTHSKDRAKHCPDWPLRFRKEFVMENVSRRKFVATAAVAGAATVLRPPAFAFENPDGND
jgi:hypothetical protein